MYTEHELKHLLDVFTSVGGAVTFNVGVFMDGSFGEKTFELLKSLKNDIASRSAKD